MKFSNCLRCQDVGNTFRSPSAPLWRMGVVVFVLRVVIFFSMNYISQRAPLPAGRPRPSAAGRLPAAP